MRSIVVGAGALVFAVACDPAWRYHVAASPPSAILPSEGPGAISMRTKAELVVGRIDVEIEITNSDEGALIVRKDPFRVVDSAQGPLAWYAGQAPDKPCQGRPEEFVTLVRGQSCTMRGRFEAHPMAGMFGGRKKNLDRLTVIVDGLARGGRPVARSVVLESD